MVTHTHILLTGRPYWLVQTVTHPYKAGKGLKSSDGSVIRKGMWIVDAEWYECISDDPQIRKYKLVEGVIHLPIGSIVTEIGLKFNAGHHEFLLGDDEHRKISQHNFSNVA